MIKLLFIILVFFVCLVAIYYFQRAHYKRAVIGEFYERRNITTKSTTIPPLVIQTIKEYEINDFFFKKVVQPNIHMNPDMDFIFYDNDRIDDFLIRHFPIHVYSTYKKINPKFGACLSDFARYCILYITGGIYIDIKSNMTKPILPLLQRYNQPDTLLVFALAIYLSTKKACPFSTWRNPKLGYYRYPSSSSIETCN